MMGSVKQDGKKKTYWFTYESYENGKWVLRNREFDSKGKADTAHAIVMLRRERSPSKVRKVSKVEWRITWKVPSGSK